MGKIQGVTLAKNQIIIYDGRGNEIFQSYNSIIAKKTKSGKVYLDKRYWDYSKTTGKYRNKFLGESVAETRKKIASKKYTLKNLN